MGSKTCIGSAARVSTAPDCIQQATELHQALCARASGQAIPSVPSHVGFQHLKRLCVRAWDTVCACACWPATPMGHVHVDRVCQRRMRVCSRHATIAFAWGSGTPSVSTPARVDLRRSQAASPSARRRRWRLHPHGERTSA